MHGHLVKIETEEENEELYNESVRLNMTQPAWIGLSDSAEEGNWVWTSGERANFTNWATGQPSNTIKDDRPEGENCVGLNTITGKNPETWEAPGKWNDSGCTRQRGAICELVV